MEAAVREVVRRRHDQPLLTTASTATSTTGAATRRRSSGKASRATPASSPTPSCTARCAASPTCCKRLGVKTGDRVAIYMPMIPERRSRCSPARASARPTASSSAASRAEALRDRINDAAGQGRDHRRRRLPPRRRRPAQGERRRGAARRRRRSSTSSSCAAPARRFPCTTGRDHWWHELMAEAQRRLPGARRSTASIRCSSSTPAARPGSRRASCTRPAATCCTPTLTSKCVFDLKDDDIFWCTADIGWVTGHSYVVYGPLANGATTVMYEGAPNHPEPDRFWQIIDELRRHVFYTAPTAIRAFIKWGDEWPRRHDLRSLRLLGTVGEPINPEAWMWYHHVIGDERCPIVDTWWQTETGGIMITPLPGATPTKPGSATPPLPGHRRPTSSRRDGKPVGANQGGFLVITQPWPGMLRTVYGDPERYKQQYWSQIAGHLLHRRRRAPRRGRLLLGHGPHRRRGERRRPPARHDGGRERARARTRRSPRPPSSAGPTSSKGQAHRRVRHARSRPARRPTRSRRSSTRARRARRSAPSPARRHPLHRRAARRPAAARSCAGCCATSPAGKETLGDTTTLEDYSVLAKLREEDE